MKTVGLAGMPNEVTPPRLRALHNLHRWRCAAQGDAMQVLEQAARVYALFMGAGGFLMGQLYAGGLSLGPTLAGLAGCVAGLCASRVRGPAEWGRRAIVLAAAVGVPAVALDAYQHYAQPSASAQMYVWFLTLPFVAALVFLALRAVWTWQGNDG
jgi:hypothetical protein